MNFEQAERSFRELKAQHDKGKLDDEAFRVEIAKLLLRDPQGTFWMLDAESGTWFCNRGEGWEPADPHAEGISEVTQPAKHAAKRRRLGRVLVLGMVVVVLLGVVGAMVLFRWPPDIWNPPEPTPELDIRVEVTIASPADGSEVKLGQEVAIETTVNASPDLQAIDRVELQVNGQTVDTQAVQSQVQPGQDSLPLSQMWRPMDVGEFELAVTALSAAGVPLGAATLTLNVAEASEEALPELACLPDAAFVADVTIPPGSVFPPGARMDKVWQVRNSGTCAWGVSYELVMIGGDDLGAPSTAPVPPTVAGATADLTLTFVAPGEAGTYASIWRLSSPEGTLFGPTLTLSIEVRVLAEESQPPEPPSSLQAATTDDGRAVRLTWEDRSDNEDAFRIYRQDMEASIGLAPANAELFVDEGVSCGITYRYAVAAFNASGVSPLSEEAEISMAPCTPPDAPPALILTVVPTQVVSSEPFTITFEATDDIAMDLVVVWGLETGNPDLDTGRIFTCTETLCAGEWPITWTVEITKTLTIVAVARDSSGHESEIASTLVGIFPPEDASDR
jgi:hypothetical protein